ncbi:glycoside hydrolase family 3 N-terminal domain-containing protein [Hydrogenoanaerobacterium sp.]|uniref:glycoside hydrolase family 3 protein n=1 Tax=Hydrogenoanaerobacterium sp. TaxID=2953763 RepID=UPI00289F1C23|nr:glycoside hydrolase family 3 N-terminal domain-containing protein [Hydrogenoanaerobacterium sp.]
MKKKLRFKLLLPMLCLCLGLCACSFNPASISDSAGGGDSKQDTLALQQISGTLEDATMNTVTVRADDKLYTFVKSDETTVQGDQGLALNRSVTLTYSGELDDSQQNQTAQLVEIVIPDRTDLERAQEILSTLSLEEKVAQMFIARCPEDKAAELAKQYQLGGYILFARDFEEKNGDEVKANIQSYQNSSKIPMLIGVDEEGGTVNRVSLYPQFRAVPFESPQRLYQKNGFDLIAQDTEEKSDLLKSLGINVNFAPVCDVSTNRSDYIYNRSFGQSPELTAQYVETVVKTMNDHNMGSVLKHFPGYGNNSDTHTGIAYDKRSYESFLNSDFKPFIAGINAGAGSVLVSHNIVSSIDAAYPASLSAEVHRILREDLKFDGVIVTDELSMNAIRNYVNAEEAAVLAVEAGNDLLCCTNFEEQIPAVVKSVENGRISEDRINESVIRILLWKLKLGITE